MKKVAIAFSVVTLVFGMMTGSALAFGANITISDNNYNANTWYGNYEDQEVEPGMETGQKWDLEGFFQNGTKVTMVGGYNFLSGEAGNGHVWKSGDLFIDVDGDAKYGKISAPAGTNDGNSEVANAFGYDFVLDFSEDLTTYSIYQITENSKVITAYYKQNYGSNPWRYAGGGELIEENVSLLDYQTGLSDAATGFLGGNHNAVKVDLGFLSDPKNTQGLALTSKFTLHYTMGCGNDNLIGSYAPVPEPSTVLLIGAGLLGLIGVSRKRPSKK